MLLNYFLSQGADNYEYALGKAIDKKHQNIIDRLLPLAKSKTKTNLVPSIQEVSNYVQSTNPHDTNPEDFYIVKGSDFTPQPTMKPKYPMMSYDAYFDSYKSIPLSSSLPRLLSDPVLNFDFPLEVD